MAALRRATGGPLSRYQVGIGYVDLRGLTGVNTGTARWAHHDGMSDLKNVVAIANQLIGNLGKDAEPIVAERAIANYLEGDHEAAALWRRVAAAIRAIEVDTEAEFLN